jgi:hypothetical protein
MPSETPRPAFGQVWTYTLNFEGTAYSVHTLLLVCPVLDLTGAWRVMRIDGGTGDTYEMYGLYASPIEGYTYIEG